MNKNHSYHVSMSIALPPIGKHFSHIWTLPMISLSRREGDHFGAIPAKNKGGLGFVYAVSYAQQAKSTEDLYTV